jgi:hypothetical protein
MAGMSPDRVAAWVVIAGEHPMGELTLYGPFVDDDQAQEWAEAHVASVGDWWLRPVWGAAE